MLVSNGHNLALRMGSQHLNVVWSRDESLSICIYRKEDVLYIYYEFVIISMTIDIFSIARSEK